LEVIRNNSYIVELIIEYANKNNIEIELNEKNNKGNDPLSINVKK